MILLIETTILDNKSITTKRLVYELIYSIDEAENRKQILQKKFKEYSPFIDYKALYGFRNKNLSIIKYCYIFNHHWLRKNDELLFL